jgi:Mn-dependent DtxR family transcriptional regulator
MSARESENYKDAITYVQPIIQEIDDPETIDVLENPNYMSVLSILRSGAQTVSEIREALVEEKLEKSTKTVYRYLKKLEDKKLVVQSGKRVYLTPDKKHKTQTLFMRSAKIFFPIKGWNEKGLKKEHHEMHEVLGRILEKKLKISLSSPDCLRKVLSKLFERETELTQELILAAEQEMGKELSELMNKLEWKQIEILLSFLGTVNIILESEEWQAQLRYCFESTE